MYKYHKQDHKSSHIWECENRSLLLKGCRRGQKSVLTELAWAIPRQSSETAGAGKHASPGNFSRRRGLVGFKKECACVNPLFCWSNVNYPYCHAARERVAFAQLNFGGSWQGRPFSCPRASGLACRPANREVAHATHLS